MAATPELWPALEYSSWKETATTLQLWLQIVGKIRLALTPWLNHSWQVPLYVSARGLTTSPMPFAPSGPSGASPTPAGYESLEIEFDFVDHCLLLRTSLGAHTQFPLVPQTVADFHDQLFRRLGELGVTVAITGTPNEVPDPIPFRQDTRHRSYDPDAAFRFWRILLQVDRVFKLFRTGFLGKASPVHFFWGSFDLASTRFSGRPAPTHPGGFPGLPDSVTREAYSHEEASVGFWPGSDSFPHAAFYAYAYPAPEGYAEAKVAPSAAFFDSNLREFLLPYDDVRSSPEPDRAILDFLQTTFDAAADLAHWDRGLLVCELGIPARPRPVPPPA